MTPPCDACADVRKRPSIATRVRSSHANELNRRSDYMNLSRILRRAAMGLALAASTFTATPPASAFSLTNGNLVVAFVKNGFELILNVGNAPTGPGGVNIDATTLALPSQFGGSLDGAKWTALAVRSPDLTFTDPDLFGAPQSNLILTTSASPSVISYGQVADGQAQLQPPNQGSAWFALLRATGAANGTSILENTANRLVIGSTFFASYSGNLGFGSDAVANTLPISTAGTVSAAVIGSSLPLYEILQTITLPNFDLGTQVNPLGSVRLVPEPGTALLLAAGLAGLVRSGRRRDA
jgi:hypothetical protein